MRKVRLFIGAALAALLIAAGVAPANADWYWARTAPHAGTCWTKVEAYGGVYLMKNAMVNDSSSSHTARIEVWRGSTLMFGDSFTGAPGQWIVRPNEAPVSIYSNDRYVYKLDGATIIDIVAANIWYLPHCDVIYGSNEKIRTAVSYGMRYLDGPYVGGASPFRFGTPGNGQWYQQSGQKRYLSPRGVIGFDCSGLVVAMYRAAGKEIGLYNSTAMRDGLPAVSPGALRTGDLIVKSGHVAIYLGDADGDGVGKVLEATPTGSPRSDGSVRGVIISSASKYLGAGNAPKYPYVLRRVPGV